ncbi:zinc-binding alcohol dehydrogenase family protein [Anaerococcus porci]|uniref:Zinc-binding alcohol dehydrogenase family protein n=1 Tax=Anaerococcus porci TaxID=2652269 RepID=A0A6N7VG01_9FIRM|nr:zinc-binding alcohol dehydrogenase family protein [Anaerococcus porci]MDY3006862.1 zinc-binding alcohol dehydrogenase family protein [Anaerococcus porci]MSS77811.1 zinc-binding alcohol dehydrogenase family protein [Anaerococcus porci]
MKAVRINKVENLEIVDLEEVQIKEPDDVKIKIKAVGICGSDVGIYKGSNPMAKYPRVIGHEMTGIVEEVGKEVKNFKKGDKVVVDPVINCGECKNCKNGRPNICENLKVRGVHVEGGFSEKIVVKDYQTYKVNKDMPFNRSVLIEPFSIGFQANRRADVKKDDVVFVMGAGTIGQTVARVAQYFGAKVFTSDMDQKKLERAKKFGMIPIDVNTQDPIEFIKENNEGRLADVVVDAICTPKTFEIAVKSAASAGRVINLGFSTQPSQIASVDITSKELDILGSRLSNKRFPEVIEAYNTGKLSFDDLVSHEMEFEDAEKAIKMIIDKDIYTEKIVLTLEN